MNGKTKKVTIKPGTPGTGVQNMAPESDHLEQGETYLVDEDFAKLLVAEGRASFADKDVLTFAEKSAKGAKGKAKDDDEKK